jgi:diguanylate cyclase (GGDEF)-like protein
MGSVNILRRFSQLLLSAGWLLSTGATLARAADVAFAPAETAHLTIEPAPPGRMPWVTFDDRSGLRQHTIVDMLVDQHGFVWAATQDGLARYNGRAWETVPLPRRMGASYPRAIRTARDGGLWIGSWEGGVAHMRDGSWQFFDTTSGLPSNRVRGLLETDNALWIATDHGVARLRDGKIQAFEAGLPSLDTEGLCETKDGVFVGTASGLARLNGDHFEAVPVPRQLLRHRISDIAESTGLSGGPALWVASYGGGMGVFEGGKWTVLDTDSGLPSDAEVITKSHARDGSPALWIGSEGGLLRFEHGHFTLYDERSGLPIRTIWKVLETISPGGLETLWLGTYGGGIVRLSPNFWTAFDVSVGMPSGSITSVLLSKDGTGADVIWAGTSDGALARYSGQRFETVELPKALQHTIIFSLLETLAADGSRILWVGSFGGGIGKLENGRWTVLDKKDLPNERVYTLVETKDDDGSSVIWAGTEGGLARYAHGKWTSHTQADGSVPSDIVTQVLETFGKDGARTLWVATSRGLVRVDAGRWRWILKSAGLPSENVVSLQVVTDAAGVRWLWAATLGGAARMPLDDAQGRWETFSSKSSPALPSDTVQSVAADRSGRIYLCTSLGVARLTPRMPTAGDSDQFDVQVFTNEDGLPSGDCQQGARLVDQYGRVWFGTARGLAMFDSRGERPDHMPKPLVIDNAALSDGSRVLHGGEVLSHRERNLTFSGALLAYADESRIRYRYQLAGFDPQPSDWMASGTKEYTNLGAGDYKFLLWGKDAQGEVSGPIELAFKVRPAPWLTLWAFAGYALLIVLSAWGVMQLRLRALAARTRQLETEVTARTKDLVAARDTLQRLATEDALTGVANRRKFDSILEQEWRRAQRDNHWLTLVLLDVDFFKRYNDRYGHARGDECLSAVATAVASQCTRPADLVARYGGEEFVMVLPEIEPHGVSVVLREVLAAVDALQIEHADSTCAPHVTISLGAVSLRPGREDEAKTAMKRADELLYEAKENGRHQAMQADATGAKHSIVC